MFLYSFDISLASTGAAIFTKEGLPVEIFSIPTSNRLETKDRLKIIADTLLDYRKKYETDFIVLESGFSRFAASTQQLFRVHGIVNYLFSDCAQIYYPSSTVKKIICGNGRADKKDVEKTVLKQWPNLTFSCNDESDACGIALCHLVCENILKLKDKRND